MAVMNTLDWILLGLIGLAALAGWKIKSLILLGLGFVFTLAPVIAFHLGPVLEPWVVQAGVSKASAPATAVFCLLVVGALVIFGLFHMLSQAFEALMLGWLDRGAGAVMLAAGLFVLLSFGVSWMQLTAGRAGMGSMVDQSTMIQKIFPAWESRR